MTAWEFWTSGLTAHRARLIVRVSQTPAYDVISDQRRFLKCLKSVLSYRNALGWPGRDACPLSSGASSGVFRNAFSASRVGSHGVKPTSLRIGLRWTRQGAPDRCHLTPCEHYGILVEAAGTPSRTFELQLAFQVDQNNAKTRCAPCYAWRVIKQSCM